MTTLEEQFNELLSRTQHMRRLQREYFQKPISGKLIAAKSAENAVDKYIELMKGQKELFNANGPLEACEIPY